MAPKSGAGATAVSVGPSSHSQENSEAQLNRVLKTIDESVRRLIEALPVNAMLLVFTCQGDTAEFRRMQVMVDSNLLQHSVLVC